VASWQQFRDEAPELARRADERFDKTGLVLVGTLRRDGWPRISPVEPIVMEGALYLGMMPGSTKSRDLQRDPRVLVHSVVSDKDGADGETKLYGHARWIAGEEERERYCQALFAKIGWRPDGDFDLFDVDIVQAADQTFGGGHRSVVWRPGQAPVETESPM
jgi:hypothetical protein